MSSHFPGGPDPLPVNNLFVRSLDVIVDAGSRLPDLRIAHARS